MQSSQDTEITLGTAKLLGLFFALVAICAIFFALGYSLGRKSEGGVMSAAIPAPSSGAAKTVGANNPPNAQMDFYKAVQQKDASPQLTPPPESATPGSGTAAAPSGTGQAAGTEKNDGGTSGASAVLPGPGYFVQVAAVTKQDDADALVSALKNKEYPAFVAANSSDKLFRVQVGPFGDIKDAEIMRARLVNDGYNPILKK